MHPCLGRLSKMHSYVHYKSISLYRFEFFVSLCVLDVIIICGMMLGGGMVMGFGYQIDCVIQLHTFIIIISNRNNFPYAFQLPFHS